MTPTEQDKELRKEIWDTLRYNQFNMETSSAVAHIMQLITADRKRVALEARIDEIEHIAGFTNGMTNQMFKNLQNRIAELKRLKEEK